MMVMATQTDEPMMVIMDGDGKLIAIVPVRRRTDVGAAVMATTKEEQGRTIRLPDENEAGIIAAALEDGGGKYAGKNPLAGLKRGEPFFFLRAQDLLAPFAVDAYAMELEAGVVALGCANPLIRQMQIAAGLTAASLEVRAIAEAMRAWQAKNPESVKLPD